jgi:hypothetical protein
MFRKLFYTILFFFPAVACLAQAAKIDIPMKKGKVYYEKSYAVSDSLRQNELYKRALKWFKSDSANTQKIKTSANKANGQISGTGIFKIVTGNTGNYYFMRFKISIKVIKGAYTFAATDFYEKPIETGVSNEYSKIEYRWWDYRQGKPWSAEDETLFKGIAADETALMASLEAQMGTIK